MPNNLFDGSASVEPTTGRQGAGSLGTEPVTVEGQRATGFGATPQAPATQEPVAKDPSTGGIQTGGEQPKQQPLADPASLLSLMQQQATQTPQQTEQVPQEGQSDPSVTEQVTKEKQVKPGEDKAELRQMLSALVKEELGVDLQALKQDQEAQRLRNEAQQLQQLWGVDQAQLSQRLTLLGQAIEQLPEPSRAAFTTPAALNVLWTAIQAQGTDTAPAWNTGSVTPAATTTLTQEAIDNMSREEYAARQGEIVNYYKSRR